MKKYYGIDLLRILAVAGVVVLHTLRRSTLLSSDMDCQYSLAWLMEIVCYFSVDVFGIISGFVNYNEDDKHVKIGNYLKLWMTVVFYGLIIVAFCDFFTSFDVDKRDYLTAIFPVLTGEYCFFSAYTGVFLLTRIINKIVRGFDKSVLYRYVILSVFIIAALETLTVKLNHDYSLFSLDNGYSFTWLSIMYFIGAVIRKTGLYKKIPWHKPLICMIVMMLFEWGWMIYFAPSVLSSMEIGHNWDRLFVEYVSPTVVISAIAVVMLFSRFNFKDNECIKRSIAIFAPGAFSVYLLNSQPLMVKYFYNTEHLSFLLEFDDIRLLPVVIMICTAFTFLALIIDIGRRYIFRICYIDDLISKVNSYNPF